MWEVDTKRAGFFVGRTGIDSSSGRGWSALISLSGADSDANGSALVGVSWSSTAESLRLETRLKSNDRGVGSSTIGEGIESLTPAAPMRVGKSWRLKGSTGVSLPSDWIVRSVSEDILDCKTLLIRISWSRVGDKTSSASRRLNRRTVSRSLAFTDHFDLCLLATGRGFLASRDF